MTKNEKLYAAWCAENDPSKFYKWRRWSAVRVRVLALDKHECQRCKTIYKRYSKATTVHHVNHFKDRPDLALEIYYRDPVTHKAERNLISLCRDCHEEIHGYRKRDTVEEPLTIERWD